MIASRKLALVSILAFCAAGLPAASMAAPPAPTVSEVKVSTADLNLGTASGVATLKQRIRAAAKTVCMNVLPNASASSDAVRTCRLDAARQARPAVQSAVREAEAKQAVAVEASNIPR